MFLFSTSITKTILLLRRSTGLKQNREHYQTVEKTCQELSALTIYHLLCNITKTLSIYINTQHYYGDISKQISIAVKMMKLLSSTDAFIYLVVNLIMKWQRYQYSNIY